MYKLALEKETRDQIPNINWIMEKARVFQKNHLLLLHWLHWSLCVDHSKLYKTLKEIGNTRPLTCLPRNLYVGQEATVRTWHEKTDWFKTGKGVQQDCILSPCLFNLYTEYIMWNARLDEAQAGIKIAGRSVNNLRYQRHPNGRKWKRKNRVSWWRWKTLKVGLKLNIQKTKIMASGPITSWQVDGGKDGICGRFYFLGLQNHCRWWLKPWS